MCVIWDFALTRIKEGFTIYYRIVFTGNGHKTIQIM